MMNTNSTAGATSARPPCRDDGTSDGSHLPYALDQLYRVINLTELTVMATDSMENDRLKSAFAVALDLIGNELRNIKVILLAELRASAGGGEEA